MKILVTFYSRSGNTKKMAQAIAECLHADLDEIIDLKNRRGILGWILSGRDALKGTLTTIKTVKNPSDYDLVIIGTPIWAGHSTPATRTYITQFKNQIKKVAIFVTSGGDGPQKTASLFENILGKKAVASVGWTQVDNNSNQYSSKPDQFVSKIR